MIKYSFVKFMVLALFLFVPLTACRSGQSEETAENEAPQALSTFTLPPANAPTARPQSVSPVAALSISPVATNAPTPIEVVIPSPSQDAGVVHGIIVNTTGLPLAGLPVYLGKYDGTLIEISLNNSPKSITDGFGSFVFVDVPPNDSSFQYAVGIIIGGDSGAIIKNPDGDGDLIFDVIAGGTLDLGMLDSGLQ